MFNSLILVIISLFIFGWGYFSYAKKLENLCEVNPKNEVPAVYKYDGIDYIPAKNWLVLFGHHFSSIAGAGPIIGPVIACLVWGWLPALLWIVLGSLFIGGVHDFCSVIISVKEGATSIADISSKVISKKAKVIFSLFVFLALILVIAVFAYLCADTFVKDNRIILPSLGLIPTAILVGLLLYRLKINSILVTILGLSLLLFLLFLGNIFPISLGRYSLSIWMVVLFLYCYFASVLPVNILLQPRDYLCSFLLFFSMIIALLGVMISHPYLKLEPFIKYNTEQGWLWPMLFVTIACGAISGFHTLIASGTTSKQLPNERFAKRIGYGGMLAEGLLAVLVVVAVASLNLDKNRLGNYLIQKGPIAIFSQGYDLITYNIFKGWGKFLAITTLNAFILTTLDTASRICRYIFEELFIIKNRFISTAIVLIISAGLAFSGQWNKIWPAFGASNQLVASFALLVISAWLIKRKKKVRFTLPFGFFMFLTTLTALTLQAVRCFFQKDYLLLSICIVLVLLGGFMLVEFINNIYKSRGKQR